MRVAFYAPLKAPVHPVPSGDRRMARLLFQALRTGGHDVELASTLRAYCASPDLLGERQRAAEAAAARLAGGLRARPMRDRPRAWLTYHLYYKAPDWIGPTVARALEVPYLVVEASSAPKRLAGPWAPGERAVAAALARAEAVLSLNPRDDDGVIAHLDRSDRLFRLPPFLDVTAYADAPARRERARADLAAEYGLPLDGTPWLATVAMMRSGDKLASYRLLAAALDRLAGTPLRLLVAGDGEARAEVAALLGNRAVFLGELGPDRLLDLYAAADLYVWPAVNEAFGMAFLEARAAGLPAVGGNEGGVAGVISDGETGLLANPRDPDALADSILSLLRYPETLRRMSREALRSAAADHNIDQAAQRLTAAIAFARENRRTGS